MNAKQILDELAWQHNNTPAVTPHRNGNGINIGTSETDQNLIVSAHGSMLALASIAASLRTLTTLAITEARTRLNETTEQTKNT